MNTAAKELALTLGMLALTTSCTAASNTSTQTQQSPSVKVRDSDKAATATIKIDGSSTVYPITQAIATITLFRNSCVSRNNVRCMDFV